MERTDSSNPIKIKCSPVGRSAIRKLTPAEKKLLFGGCSVIMISPMNRDLEETDMNIYEAQTRSPALLQSLLVVWEKSVRATHLFLSDAEIKRIKEYVPQALRGVSRLIVAEKEQAPIAFMGVEHGRLEMLFLLPSERGKGLGKQLLQLGIQNYDVVELTVNEQNPQAVGFYEHLGFEAYKRTDHDEEGNPYPLLFMRLRN